MVISPCKKCGGERRRKPSGQPVCDVCKREEAKAYRRRNSEAVKIYTRKHYELNLEAERLRSRLKYLRDKDKIKLRTHPLRARYGNMIDRCYNPDCRAFKNYGGRKINPIKVCDRWLGPEGFKNFVEDLYPTWKPGLTLERVNNDGNYEPSNCKWATRREQSINTRRRLEHRKATPDNSPIYYPYGALITLGEFAEEVGLPLIVAKYRYAINWNAEWILDKDSDHRYYIYRDHHYNILELCLLSGFSYDVMRSRITKYGWSVEKAMETPLDMKMSRINRPQNEQYPILSKAQLQDIEEANHR